MCVGLRHLAEPLRLPERKDERNSTSQHCFMCELSNPVFSRLVPLDSAPPSALPVVHPQLNYIQVPRGLIIPLLNCNRG